MPTLTKRELTYLQDVMNANNIVCTKCKDYSTLTQDTEVSDILKRSHQLIQKSNENLFKLV